MFTKRYYYLITIQYLGFRFHGWQHQPGQKTIEGMLKRTLGYVFTDNDRTFKILGAGRTDAKVSAHEGAFELFIKGEPLADLEAFLESFNRNLPQDIRALAIRPVNKDFNVIKDAKIKEYVYLFSHGQKNHPFCAPFMANIIDTLDIDTMTKAAPLFEGTHNFKSYTVRPNEKTQFEREVLTCRLKKNDLYTASFFPAETFALHVYGAGFMRYQIRKMAGALIQVGLGNLSVETIQESLKPNSDIMLEYVAPASGLVLNRVEFQEN